MPRLVFRARPAWTDPETDTDSRRSAATFHATWRDTTKQLLTEADHLGGDLVVIEVVCDELDLRQDGQLRARAQIRHPGAVVSFDSKHGPLRYATDAYECRYYGNMPDWQANVRAITLALTALRAVDRYGVTTTGQQYRGWTAIGATPMPDAPMTVERAAGFIAAHAGGGWTAATILTGNREWLARAYRHAARNLHPDHPGGGTDQVKRLQAAKRVLDEHHAGGGRPMSDQPMITPDDVLARARAAILRHAEGRVPDNYWQALQDAAEIVQEQRTLRAQVPDWGTTAYGPGTWRVGAHYGLHVYERGRTGNRDDDRPVATFHRSHDATVAVDAVNAARTRSEAGGS